MQFRPRMCSYSLRWFYSKGALLVLIWTILVMLAAITLMMLFFDSFLTHEKHVWNLILFLPLCSYLVFAPLSGWLADARFGSYKLIRVGFVLLFVSSICYCVLGVVVSEGVPFNSVFVNVLVILSSTVTGIAVSVCLVTSIQLGLDQMPDASSSNITSFIAWFISCIWFGLWFSDSLFSIIRACIDSNARSMLMQFWSLVPALCMAVVLILDFVVAPKLIIIEPKSPQSLKTIYQVLKFAAKHKAPLNRSALTYWEEDIPSRMDLAKSRYGGPFTTEQVEDVKTFFKLFIVTLPLWTMNISLTQIDSVFNATAVDLFSSVCLNQVAYYFTYHDMWCLLICIVLYEFTIYPFIKHYLPSILKRIGIVLFCVVLVNAIFLTCTILVYCGVVNYNSVFSYSNRICIYLSVSALFTSSLELVCAQAPYSMRGLFSGYVVFVISIIMPGSVALTLVSNTICDRDCSNLICFSVKLASSLVGFISHCFLARWYKRRVRDDGFVAQRIVEEVYDRYLSSPS
ncbi:solute carrier family 15 member 4-like [Halichondria panicea]|uniref:solute carrier family 15 member 4-like n=1 Tax=Halichondria panicea TaxID=6063 RepID=UPI00312B2C01